MTRDIGISRFITPTGRQANLVVKANLWSFRLSGVGNQPVETGIWYTGRTRAAAARDAYLKKFWDLSDEAASKRK